MMWNPRHGLTRLTHWWCGIPDTNWHAWLTDDVESQTRTDTPDSLMMWNPRHGLTCLSHWWCGIPDTDWHTWLTDDVESQTWTDMSDSLMMWNPRHGLTCLSHWWRGTPFLLTYGQAAAKGRGSDLPSNAEQIPCPNHFESVSISQ